MAMAVVMHAWSSGLERLIMHVGARWLSKVHSDDTKSPHFDHPECPEGLESRCLHGNLVAQFRRTKDAKPCKWRIRHFQSQNSYCGSAVPLKTAADTAPGTHAVVRTRRNAPYLESACHAR